MAGFMASRARAYAPGEHFAYATGSSVLLLRELQAHLGPDLTRSYPALYALAFAPLGIASAVIEPDETGGLVGGSYAHMTARDWLRVGQLFLDDGIWQGKRLLPEGFVKYATTPTKVKPSFGASFWLNTGRDPRERLYPTLPEELYLLRGRDGQFVAIIPSKRLLVARFGLTPVETWDNSFEPLVRGVLASLAMP
jgi:CubicO group peptidase (beta-lactamase class C family)